MKYPAKKLLGLTQEQADQIETLARARGVSVSGFIRWLISRAIEEDRRTGSISHFRSPAIADPESPKAD